MLVRPQTGQSGSRRTVHLAELARERVEEEQPAEQRLADAERELERLVRLERADDPGSTPSTPPSEHDGASSGGGGCGNRQR